MAVRYLWRSVAIRGLTKIGDQGGVKCPLYYLYIYPRISIPSPFSSVLTHILVYVLHYHRFIFPLFCAVSNYVFFCVIYSSIFNLGNRSSCFVSIVPILIFSAPTRFLITSCNTFSKIHVRYFPLLECSRKGTIYGKKDETPQNMVHTTKNFHSFSRN